MEGRHEELLFLGSPGELAAYEELRAGFTAAVSHELRTPLARLLVLLESMDLPGEDPHELALQARAEVQQIGELIDDVLFLSELETGKEVVALGSTPVQPLLSELAAELAERAARADLELRFEAEPGIELPLRPRMLRIVLENLAENALRYAGPRARFSIEVSAYGRGDRPPRGRQRGGRRRGRSRPAVRALLPRRPGALLARHRPRARDREARRHRRGRDDRGGRRARPRPRDPLRLPGLESAKYSESTIPSTKQKTANGVSRFVSKYRIRKRTER